VVRAKRRARSAASTLSGTWIQGRQRVYEPAHAGDSLEHVLGLPRLDFSAKMDAYWLVDTQSQIEALDAAMRLTMPERAGSVRTLGEVREAERRRRERQHEVPPASSAQPEAARDRRAAAEKRAAAREQQLTRTQG